MNHIQRQLIKEAYKEGYESALNEDVFRFIRRLLGMDDAVPPRAPGIRQKPVDTGDVIVDTGDVIVDPPKRKGGRPLSNEPGRMIRRSINKSNTRSPLDTPIGADDVPPGDLDTPINDLIDKIKKQIDDDPDIDTPIG